MKRQTTLLLTVPVPTNLTHKFQFLVHTREMRNLTTVLISVPVLTNLRHKFKFLVQQREDKLNYSIINCSCPHKFKTQIQILSTAERRQT